MRYERQKKMYWQEHFLPVINTNGLALAKSKAQLIAFINEALHQPEEMLHIRRIQIN